MHNNNNNNMPLLWNRMKYFIFIRPILVVWWRTPELSTVLTRGVNGQFRSQNCLFGPEP
jgi:hypothetical protein